MASLGNFWIELTVTEEQNPKEQLEAARLHTDALVGGGGDDKRFIVRKADQRK